MWSRDKIRDYWKITFVLVYRNTIVYGPFDTYEQALKEQAKHMVECGCGNPDCKYPAYEIDTI